METYVIHQFFRSKKTNFIFHHQDSLLRIPESHYEKLLSVISRFNEEIKQAKQEIIILQNSLKYSNDRNQQLISLVQYLQEELMRVRFN